MPRFAALRPGEIEMKAVDDPVTIADREAELMIGASLRSLLSHARVVGEEACAADPSLMAGLDEGAVWIIDPIDGTANFAAGRPPFAMMVALLLSGETVGSWILDPLSDRLCVAQRGGGAWIDGQRIRTTDTHADLGDLCGIVSQSFVPAGGRTVIDQLSKAIGEVVPTARCAGHEYPLVATGVRHFALYWRTLIWDHAPGALLLTEAGGVAMHLDSSDYRPARQRTGLLLAHNRKIAEAVIGLIEDKD